jgi:hypothetical protein
MKSRFKEEIKGEVRDTLFSEGGERASFCWKVPRLRPLILLVGIM